MSYSSYSSGTGSSRQRTIVFCCSVIAHIGLLFVPMLLLFLDGCMLPREEEEFNINIVETPATAEEIAPIVQQPPPSEVEQPEESNPEPVPEPEITPPPVPELPQPIPAVAQPEFDLPQPVPEEEKPKKTVAQPKFKMPTVPKTKPKPKPQPKQDRKLVNTKNTKPKSTKSKSDPRIPIGKTATGQIYGKNSNTPQGGKLSESAYERSISTFLKMKWREYTPTQAHIGDAKPETLTRLTISPEGKLISAKITKSSGVAAMDQAVIRMLNDLAKMQLPKPLDGKNWSNEFNFQIEKEQK